MRHFLILISVVAASMALVLGCSSRAEVSAKETTQSSSPPSSAHARAHERARARAHAQGPIEVERHFEPQNEAIHYDELFEKTVKLIKKYEGLHHGTCFVGYGHLVQRGENFSRSKPLTEAEADKLLRKDLLKNCAVFRSFGADSLLLGTLAYNIGSGNVKRSSVARKLAAGDRNIKEDYLNHCKYRGKTLNQLRKRRQEEYDLIFARKVTDTKRK